MDYSKNHLVTEEYDLSKKFNANDDDSKETLKFQVFRDLAMMSDPPNILLYYEELIKQFGYIVLFSSVFPLAAFMSYVSNSIQVKSQIQNLKYQRRFKAEVSNGIGNWLNCLENLCQLGIIVNCAGVFFTSKIYMHIFVSENDNKMNDYQKHVLDATKNHSDLRLSTGWAPLNFFIVIVIIEHILLILKVVMEYFIDDVPDKLTRGERDRQGMIEQYIAKKKGADDDLNRTQDVKDLIEKIEKSRSRICQHLEYTDFEGHESHFAEIHKQISFE